jgi:hypothetical protein
MPQHGTLADITKRIGTTVMGSGEESEAVAAAQEPSPVVVEDSNRGEPTKSE